MHLYLIRHAESENNAKPEPQRVEDPGITQRGHLQCVALAAWLRTVHVDVLVTSAFRRTLQTTEYCADALQIEPHIWRDLHEVGGCYRGYLAGQEEGRPGLSRKQIEAEFSRFVIDPLIGDDGWWASKPYESTEGAMLRAGIMIDKIVREFGQTTLTICAVIHADFKVCMLRQLLRPDFTDRRIGAMHNVGVSKFHYREPSWTLEMLNSVTHLPAEALAGQEA